ncbi:MAG: lactate racemase domain-containing protein [Terriglobia bacterium]
MPEVQLRTGVWTSEREISLRLPDEWEVDVQRPRTPAPLTDRQIDEALDHPVGRPTFTDLCRGKRRPLIIVDDVNRATPVARVLPSLLVRLHQAGIEPGRVRILLASGSHGAPSPPSVRAKVGPIIAAFYRVLLHDPERNLAKMGRTSRGTPVFVNREVPASDVIIGVGGLFPNHMAGLGGGTKLAIGVLGMRSIAGLHFGHRPVGWGRSPARNPFREEVDEIARMIGLTTVVTVHCDAARQPIRIACGDPRAYYAEEAAFVKRAFGCRGPGDADVVIANTYPADLSLTFARKKGFHPVRNCPPSASRIAIGACSEGLGLHRLYPVGDRSIPHRVRTSIWKLASKGPRGAARALVSRALSRNSPSPEVEGQNPLWLYLTASGPRLPTAATNGARVSTSWPEIMDSVHKEHDGRKRLKVMIYACAPMQLVDRNE